MIPMAKTVAFLKFQSMLATLNETRLQRLESFSKNFVLSDDNALIRPDIL